MKQPETLLNTLLNGNQLNGITEHEIGDDHLYTGLETPLREDAFNLSDTKKKRRDIIFVWRNNESYGA